MKSVQVDSKWRMMIFENKMSKLKSNFKKVTFHMQKRLSKKHILIEFLFLFRPIRKFAKIYINRSPLSK